MGWENREGGRYYYRAWRCEGRVVKEYVGSGPMAQLAERMDLAEREKTTQRMGRAKARRARIQQADALVTTLAEVTDLLARAALLEAGYRQHHRGEWRWPRGEDGKP